MHKHYATTTCHLSAEKDYQQYEIQALLTSNHSGRTIQRSRFTRFALCRLASGNHDDRDRLHDDHRDDRRDGRRDGRHDGLELTLL